MVLKVRNYKDFAYFNYNTDSKYTPMLGSVLKKGKEIGVIIQVHAEGEVRTDTWGNSSLEETTFATNIEIAKYRPELLKELTTTERPSDSEKINLKKVKVLETGKISENLWENCVRELFYIDTDTITYYVWSPDLDDEIEQTDLDKFLLETCGCEFGEKIVIERGNW